jgi:hypothetical protein
MAKGEEKPKNDFQQLFADVKEYVQLQTDYLQIGLIEKLTKLFSKIIFGLIAFVLIFATLFYLLFALAYVLKPHLGEAGSFAIIGSIFIVLLLIIYLFRKKLIINPILKMMVDVFSEKSQNENKQEDENDSTTL